MDLTARDIHEKQFHDSWRGYNQEEVDEFLDRLADVVDRLQRENSALHARINELDHAVATSRDTEEMLKKTLVTAQQAAEEAIASAKAKAEALIQEAEERTRRANREADEKLQAADAEARRKGLEADREHTIRKREVDASLEKLRRFETDLKRRLTSFLGEQQRGLERLTEEEPPRYQPPRSTELEPRSGALPPIASEIPPTHDEGAEGDVVSNEDEDALPQGGGDEPTGQWIPDFVASREVADDDQPAQTMNASSDADQNGADQNGSDSGSWEEPGFVREADIGALYGTGEIETIDTADESPADEQVDTVTLGEEETAPARQRSRLFWRGDN
jgi:cell division initiation protein